MKNLKPLHYIHSLSGVEGCFLASSQGQILGSTTSQYSDEALSEVARKASCILDTLRLEIPSCEELRLDLDRCLLLVRYISSEQILIIMVDSESELPDIRTASDITVQSLIKNPVSTEDTTAEPSRYETLEAIGEGGTAIVYRAFDKNLSRDVALKRFNPGADTDEAHSDYSAELEAIGKLDHLNVVNVYDVGKDDEGHFIAMALIKGEDLEQKLTREALAFTDFLPIAEQSLEGLQAIHSSKVLHLDLKPSNLMISTSDRGRIHLRIVDFGRSHVLDADDHCQSVISKRGLDGSIHFMSPEQFSGQALDVRSDIYSLGCTFYYLLTQSYPFQGDSAIQIMASHIQHQVVSLDDLAPELPEQIRKTVMAMIALDPEQRPQSVEDILDLMFDEKTAPEMLKDEPANKKHSHSNTSHTPSRKRVA